MLSHPLRYAISDRNLSGASEEIEKLSPSNRTALLAHAAALASRSIDFFQLREKDLHPSTLAALACDLLAVLAGSRTRLLLSGRLDIALATQAPGVHLTADPDELTPTEVHTLYARAGLPPPLVTVSCHTLKDVERHRAEPLTAMLFGPVFEKVVRGDHVGQGTGLDLLEQACQRASPVPVLALGGVHAGNWPACAAAGAAGLAGIRFCLPPVTRPAPRA